LSPPRAAGTLADDLFVPGPGSRTLTSLDPRAPLVLDTRELGRRPGSQRQEKRTVPAPADLGIEVLRVPEGSPVELDLRLEAVMEGVLVTGSASAELAGECARCLEPITDEIDVRFQELFVYDDQDYSSEEDDDLSMLEGDLLDLEPLLRDAVVDACHREGIGVWLDWVPGHFPDDPHGLGYFDGTALYEHANPMQGRHLDWGTLIYNYGRTEVVNFLVSNALFWLDRYGVDGLRVDAVASMLYLDYSRPAGEWIPNRHGGRENLEAIEFLRRFNTELFGQFPEATTAAEESTAWPQVSQPVEYGGLGFGFKWNMGWMHDTLKYIGKDPVYRKHHHGDILFGLHYAFSENFILPLSHDEVVHGKRSIVGRMPGDEWQRFANLRAYYSFMFGHPGKKLLFMGCEFGQEREWNHDQSLDWHLLGQQKYAGIQNLIRDLNHLYRDVPALHEMDCNQAGFEWVITHDSANNIFAWLRKGFDAHARCLVVVNFSPSVLQNYRVRVPFAGRWKEALNSDSARYGGGNVGNGGAVHTLEGSIPELSLTIPPLAAIFLVPES